MEISLLLNKINEFPQTYNTLLSGCNTPTNQIIIRRKINILLKNGEICKSVIPSTRFGMYVFFNRDKKHNIIVEANRIRPNIYCVECDKYTKKKYDIYIDDGYILNCDKWMPKKDIILFEGRILKWI